MPTIICPFCKQSYDVETDIIGKKVQCAVCNESFIAHQNSPKQQDILQTKKSSFTTVSCPFCRRICSIETEKIGKTVQCDFCNKKYVASFPAELFYDLGSRQHDKYNSQSTRRSTTPPYHFTNQSQPLPQKKSNRPQNVQSIHMSPPQCTPIRIWSISQASQPPQYNQPPQYTYNPPPSPTDKTKQKNNAPVVDIKNIILSLLAIAVIIVLGVGTMASGEHDSSSSSSSSHIEINGRYHMPSGAVGFTSKDNFEKFRQLCKQNDSSASKSYLVTHMVAGDAIMFSGGETVIVSDLSPWSGMAKVRKTGDYQEFWVYSSWLE